MYVCVYVCMYVCMCVMSVVYVLYVMYVVYVLYEMYVMYVIYYESQPVGLTEVIAASEASLGGPGGRLSQMSKNRVK